MKKILAAVVTYNRLEQLKKTINAIESQTKSCDILLVNNASTDDTEAWALSHAESLPCDAGFRFLYENTGANLGGAGGFNYGMRRSVELGYDLVWIMDDDAVPTPNALEKLLDADEELCAKGKEYGFLSSVVRWKDGALCKMNLQRLSDHYLQEADIDKAVSEKSMIPVECATFVSLLIPTDIIVRVGLPIKEFFIWCDDIEYTTRITYRQKIPAYVIPDSVVIHETKVNSSSNIVYDDYERMDRNRFSIRNGNYAYRHYRFRTFLAYAFDLASRLFAVWFRSPDHKKERSRIIISSFFKGLVFNPKVEYVNKSES